MWVLQEFKYGDAMKLVKTWEITSDDGGYLAQEHDRLSRVAYINYVNTGVERFFFLEQRG